MWGIIAGVAKWILNNKLAALFLVLLLIASTALVITKGVLSIRNVQLASKQAEIEEQQRIVRESQAIRKEHEANIAALKLYSQEQAAQKKKAEEVANYLSTLSPKTVEALNSEEVREFNHNMFSYFRDRVLPKSNDNKAK